MNRRRMLTLTTMLIALSGSSAVAQQPADIEGVKTAGKAFYAALTVLNDGTAMEGVWARTPYATYVGPQSKSTPLGGMLKSNTGRTSIDLFSQRTVSLVEVHIRVNGNVAWEMGVETGQAQLTNGTTGKVDWFVTNIYEKTDGRWFMVSHHVQPRPQ